VTIVCKCVLQRLSFVSPPLSHLDEEDIRRFGWKQKCANIPLDFLSLSSFSAPFCALHAVFCLQSCVCRQRSSFFWVCFLLLPLWFLFAEIFFDSVLTPRCVLVRPNLQILYKKEFSQDFAFACLCLFVSWGFFFSFFVGFVGVVVLEVLVSGVLWMLKVVLAAVLYYYTTVCFSFQIHSSCF
jgi:hypothetical protein